MSPVVTFFNNKGGVGKTSLVYHLAWMYTQLGSRVLTVDLDPQANLTAAMLPEDDHEDLWSGSGAARTAYGAVGPLLRGVGDIGTTPYVEVDHSLALVPGDLALSRFEDQLSSQWLACLSGDERAFRVIAAFRRLIDNGTTAFEADLVLVDVGPNLGAINRAALVASDHVVVPLAPDLFSLQGLRNLGPTLRSWRSEWQDRLSRQPSSLEFTLPEGAMRPAGYVLKQHGVRLGQMVGAYQRWSERIPGTYRSEVLDDSTRVSSSEEEAFCLARLKHYRSLIPMAQDARKPVFDLKPADGAFGGHQAAVREARRDFRRLAGRIEDAIHPLQRRASGE